MDKIKVVIFGTGQFSELMFSYLKEDQRYEVIGFTVDLDYCKQKEHLGLPLIPFQRLKEFNMNNNFYLLLSIGYSKMNTIREMKYQEAKKMNIKLLNYIHPTAVLLSDDIGEGNIILEGTIIGKNTTIGNANIFYPQSHVAHHTIVGNFNFIAISAVIAGNVVIGNNCMLMANSTIRNRINVADYTLVGAAAYLNEDSSKYAVYVPARTVLLQDKKSIDMSINKHNISVK